MTEKEPIKGNLVVCVEKATDLKVSKYFEPYIKMKIAKFVKKTEKRNYGDDNKNPVFGKPLFFQNIDFNNLPADVLSFQLYDAEEDGDEDQFDYGYAEIKIHDLFQDKVNYLTLDLHKGGQIHVQILVVYSGQDMYENLEKGVMTNDEKENFLFKTSEFDFSSKKKYHISGDGKLSWKIFEGLEVDDDEEKYLNLDWKLEYFLDKNNKIRGLFKWVQDGMSWSNVKVKHKYVILGELLNKGKEIDLIVYQWRQNRIHRCVRMKGKISGKKFKGTAKIIACKKRSTYKEDYAEMSGTVVRK